MSVSAHFGSAKTCWTSKVLTCTRLLCKKVRGEHGDLLALLVRARQIAVLAVEQVGVRRVPVLHHLQALADLLAHLRIREIAADERRAPRAPQFLDRLVGVPVVMEQNPTNPPLTWDYLS